MTLDLDAIEARARAATPGPWNFARNGLGTRWWMLTPDDSNKHDTEHIAGMDPTTTLALTAEVRKLREALAEVCRAAHSGGPTAHRMLRVKQIIDEAKEPSA